MKRILSLIAALVFVMSLTSVFAATADWNGYYIAKYATVKAEQSGVKGYNSYAWQKMELYPTWKLSDNVAFHAGFYHQQFWGVGRTQGQYSPYAIQTDDGGYSGPVVAVGSNGTAPYYATASASSSDPLGNNQIQRTTLGVSSAWATLTFMDQKLGIDIGRRMNAEWGTGMFFGGKFAPDRVFVTYKTSGMGGLIMPYFIYEKRLDTDSTTVNDNVQQFLAGFVYLVPGKTLVGLTATYVDSGKAITRYGTFTGAAYGGDTGKELRNGKLYAADIYADHKIAVGDMTIKPIFEIVWATGKIADKNYYPGGALGDIYGDVLNFVLKAEVTLPKLVMITPEVIFQKAPKAATATKSYINFWGANEYNGNDYQIGHIFNGFSGGLSGGSSNPAFNALGFGAGAQPASTLVAKIKFDALILNEFVKGLGAYAWFVYAMPLGKAKVWTATGAADLTDSDKATVMEIALGLSYAIDSYAKVGADFAYAKTGKYAVGQFANVDVISAAKPSSSGVAFAPDTTYLYFGMNLTVKF